MSEETKHTPEPWRLQRDCKDIYALGRHVATVDDNHSEDLPKHISEEDQANARRIVACVNKCAGVSIDRLEAMEDGEITQMMNYFDEVEEQRKEYENGRMC